ncbi:hypothetical protein O0I10_000524 [Lichtheimia ornata]|uniref:Reverse transcriptase domain-containing protein n=1 Tax=Lichtheimia ornata TaxID=688661 RepID=A0AAD8DID9_9FUNG|nr:uncharacterized protein O0I10_000524 [Lichtheimia ornata]KAJ8663286.1 hypothetical protein O0I10_000524 [Lichtheimia ornata]
MMNSILGDFLDKFALVYLDDILIFSRTKEDHLKHVRMVLDRLRAHKLYANIRRSASSTRLNWSLSASK